MLVCAACGRPSTTLRLGLIFCFTKPPIKGGFVHQNIDRKGQNCYFVHQNPQSGGFCANEYHGSHCPDLITAGDPGRACPCRTETAATPPARDYCPLGPETQNAGPAHSIPPPDSLASPPNLWPIPHYSPPDHP